MKEYNEASIRMCGDFAEDFFRNFDKYKDQYKANEFFSDFSFDILKKRNAVDNYILKYYSQLDVRNPVYAMIKKNMDRYLTVLYKRFVAHPTELLGSPFLKTSKIVDTYCPATIKIGDTTIDFRKKVKQTYMKNVKNPKALYIMDRNSDNLSKEDTDRLMHFLIKNIGTDDKEIRGYQEAYLKKLISQKSRVRELSPKQVEFIAKYINNLMLTSRLKELGDSREDIQCDIYIGEDRKELGGFENGYNIYINKNSILTTDIPTLIQTVCHETEHSIQELEAAKNPNSKIGLDLAISNVLRDYFSSGKGYDVYHNNYRFEQIEQDAEHSGYFYAKNYLSTLGFNEEYKKLREIQTRENASRRFEYDYRIDEKGGKYNREEFFFNNLNNAIAKNPNLVTQYPALAVLYKADGKVKSFEELISGDFIFNSDEKCKIPEDFCRYYISKGALDTLDLSRFSEETQANIASRLITILSSEVSQITTMGQGKQQGMYKAISENDKKHVEYFHLVISQNIMKFMNKNYNYFRKLQDNGKFSSMMNMEYYDGKASPFRFDNIYINLAYKNLDFIKEMKEVAFEAEKNKLIYRNNKNQPGTFNSNALESSFGTLVANARFGEFQNATQVIKALPRDTTLQVEQGVEEK